MQDRFFGQENVLSSSVVYGHVGQYSHLMFRMAGTNQAGQTTLISEFGVIRVEHEGEQIANIDLQYLMKLTNLLLGVPESASAAGAAFTFTVHLPLRGIHDKNVLHVKSRDSLKIFLPAASAGVAKIVSGSYTVKGCIDFGPELYIPKLFQSSDTATGYDNPRLTVENMLYLAMFEPSTAPSYVQITRSGNLLNEGSWAELEASTNMITRIESSTEDTAICDMCRSGNLVEAIGRQYSLLMIGAVGTITYAMFGAKFDSRRAAESQLMIQRQIGSNIVQEPNVAAVQTPVIEMPRQVTRGRVIRPPASAAETPDWGII